MRAAESFAKCPLGLASGVAGSLTPHALITFVNRADGGMLQLVSAPAGVQRRRLHAQAVRPGTAVLLSADAERDHGRHASVRPRSRVPGTRFAITDLFKSNR